MSWWDIAWTEHLPVMVTFTILSVYFAGALTVATVIGIIGIVNKPLKNKIVNFLDKILPKEY